MAPGDRTGCWHGLYITERVDGDLDLEIDDQAEWLAWLEEQVWGYERPPMPQRPAGTPWTDEALWALHRFGRYLALEAELPWARIGKIHMAPDLVACHYPDMLETLS